MEEKSNQDAPPQKKTNEGTGSGLEYNSSQLVAAYATCIQEHLWMHTTTFSFTTYVMNGRSDALKGAAILDLACGEGIFSRWAASQGASRVVGVDLSEKQIACAKEVGTKHGGRPIEYVVKDVLAIGDGEFGKFDLVIAVHLLCYATNREQLHRMLKVVSSCLKKGGRFVGVRECLDSASKGKALTKVKGDLKGGPMFSYELQSCANDAKEYHDFCHCKLAFRNSDGSQLEFISYAVYESTMIEMFTEVGFKINSVGPRLSCSPEGQKLFPPDFITRLTDDWGKIVWYFDVTKL